MRIGISRRVDSLGRIVIPKEFRKSYHIDVDDEIEFIGTDQGILLKVPGIEIKRKQETS